MQKLSESMKEASRAFHDEVEPEKSSLPMYAEDMRSAAVEWSKACLHTFRDELLRKGLNVSAAIADFLAELEKGS